MEFKVSNELTPPDHHSVADLLAGGEVIVWRRALRSFTGTAFGLSQQVIQVELSLSPGNHISFTAIDSYMEELTGESLDFALAAQTGSSALLMRVYHFYAALLRSANIPVFDDCVLRNSRQNPETGMVEWNLSLPTPDPQLTIRVLQWLVRTVNALMKAPRDADSHRDASSSELEGLKRMFRKHSLNSTNMIHFLRAAHQLSMPFADLGSGIYAIGIGRNCRWFNSTITDQTSNIGCRLAKNKQASASLLRKFCLPVPEHQLAPTEERAVAVAAALGYPVVVKPLDEDQGRGVFAGLRDERSLRQAYKAAREFSEKILVERHHDGDDYRLTVMHNQVIKVMHRQAASVTGDGQHTVAELIEAFQNTSDQQQALRRDGKLRLELDDEVMGLLEEQGVRLTDIPAAGRALLLRRKSNISVGGRHHRVPLEHIHPDNCALAIRAAGILGLDFAGIDLIIKDIALPWHQTGAIICEVNAQPQLGYRDMPELYGRILQQMISDGGKIPLYLLPVAADALPADAQLKALADRLGCNAFSTPSAVWRDGSQVAWYPQSSFDAAKVLLLDRQTASGLMVMTFDDILRHGLPVADFQLLDISWNARASDPALESRTAKAAKALLNTHQQRRARKLQIQQGSAALVAIHQ